MSVCSEPPSTGCSSVLVVLVLDVVVVAFVVLNQRQGQGHALRTGGGDNHRQMGRRGRIYVFKLPATPGQVAVPGHGDDAVKADHVALR